jgi:spermidine synthase
VNAPHRTFSPLRLAILYAVFFVSGAAGLIYEITWTRALSYVFGSGTYALSAVVVAYMGGLALGARVAGRRSDRIAKPILLYVMLEFGIALCGLLLPEVLGRLSVIDRLTHALGSGGFALLTAGRFLATVLALLVPTALMGATLPLLAVATVQTDAHLGRRIGSLYGINALGAVAGAFIAGFALIPAFGMAGATYAAVGLNVAAAFVAGMLWFSESMPAVHAPPEPAADTPPRKRLLLPASVALAGFASLGCQILWSRSLPFTFEFLSSTTYCYSALLGVFIAGLALGGGLAALVADRQEHPAHLYGMTLVLIGIAISVSSITLLGGAGGNMLGIPLDTSSQDLDLGRAAANIILQTALVLGVPTLLMGMALPLAVRALATARDVGAHVGDLYVLNTLGGVAGILVVTFVAIPAVGVTTSLLLMAVLDVGLGLAILAREGARHPLMLLGGTSVAVLALIAWIVPFGGGFRHASTADMLEIYYDEGPVATIGVYQDRLGDRFVYVDGHGVAGTSVVMQTDQKSLAHLPMMLVGSARRALTVGFGSGGASYSFLLYPELERVDLVEIAPEIVGAAPYLRRANHGFLADKDPRYRIIEDDARAYLQYTDITYDIIATDCTDLRYKLNANLYDREYFEAARRALSPDGVVVVWMPLGGLSDQLFRLTLRTFVSVFPQTAVFYMHNVGTEYVLLVGWRQDARIDYQVIRQRLRHPRVEADLAEIYLDNPLKLLATFVTSGERLRQFVGEGPLNTEDTPILEFEAPRHGYNDDAIVQNLRRLYDHRDSVRKWLVRGSLSPAEERTFIPYESAVPAIVVGLIHERLGRFGDAQRAFRRAQDIAPDDRGLAVLMEFPILQKRAERGSLEADLILASLMLDQDRFDRAAHFVALATAFLRQADGGSPAYRRQITNRIESLRARLDTARIRKAKSASARPPHSGIR